METNPARKKKFKKKLQIAITTEITFLRLLIEAYVRNNNKQLILALLVNDSCLLFFFYGGLCHQKWKCHMIS